MSIEGKSPALEKRTAGLQRLNSPLLYRRQFLMSDAEIELFYSWKKIIVANRFSLMAHPDLEVSQVTNGESELTLLGYIIDPARQHLQNCEILRQLLSESQCCLGLIKRTSRFCGRWILIVHIQKELFLFQDPTGLRSVFYTDSSVEPFYCASHPGLITAICGCRYSNEAREHFLNSSYHKTDKEYWWPSGTSLYQGIKHLIPNHYLDLKQKEIKRFWPWEKIGRIDPQEGGHRAAELLKQLLEGAAARYQLALAVTAGIDTRTLLAGTIDISSKIYYYTLIYYDFNHNSWDVRIPARLLSSSGLQHHILDCSEKMDDQFRDIYMANVDMAHEAWGHIAWGLVQQYPSERLCVKGNAAEIARCFYYKKRYPKRLDGYILSELAEMPGNQFASLHFGRWLSDSMQIARDSNIDILDLFYWEHRMGSWQAMSQLEWDIAQEAYTPYNCRELLTILLSVDRQHRKPPQYILFQNIIRNLWPDILREPINPTSVKKKLKLFLREMLKKTDTYHYVKSTLSKL